MIVVDKTNFEAEVLQADGLVFIDFWSPSCGPCMALLPDVEAFAERNEGKCKFCKVDGGANKRLLLSQKLMGLPTLAFYKGGERVATWSKDDIDLDAIQAWLDEQA